MSRSVKEYKQWLEELRKDKTPFLNLWQLIAKYLFQKVSNFTSSPIQGEIVVADVFDDSTLKAARKLAMMLVGMIWQGGSSVVMKAPEGVKESAEIKDYFRKASEKNSQNLDDPNNGLVLALQEYMHGEVGYGTSGIGCYPGSKGSVLEFQSYGVEECTVDEDNKGMIDATFIEKEWTIRKLIQEYGKDKVSSEVRELYEKGKGNEKVKFCIAIAPREGFDPTKDDVLNMPIERLDFEWKTDKILLRSGYQEQAIRWSRYYKLKNEKYGRSPGTDSMASTLEAQFFKELRIDIMEKTADPPIVVPDDGVGGAGIIDTSAGGVIVENVAGRQNASRGIYPLFEGKNPPITKEALEEIRQEIDDHFSIDRLLDFSTDREMTFGEAQIRESIRSQSMFSLFSSEVGTVNSMCERSVSIQFRAGELGVMPDSLEAKQALAEGNDDVLIIPQEIADLIVQGKEFYKLEFTTPAARLLKAEQAKGVLQTWEFAGANPAMASYLDPKRSLEIVMNASGAPNIMYTEKTIKAMEEKAAADAEQQQQVLLAQGAAKAAKDATAAQANAQGAPVGQAI